MSTLENGGTDPEDRAGADRPPDGSGPAGDAAGPTHDAPPVLDPDVVPEGQLDDDGGESRPGPVVTAPSPGTEGRPQPTLLVDPATSRRVPRYGRFALVGVVLGIVVAFVFSRFGEPTEYLDSNGMFLVLLAMLAPFGALLGCAVALVLERRARRGGP